MQNPSSRRNGFVKLSGYSRHWDLMFVKCCCLPTQSQVVTPPEGCLALEKGGSLKMLTCKIAIQDASKVFSKSSTAVEELISAGENGIVCLYNGNSDDSLDGLRYKNVQRKGICECSTFVQVHQCCSQVHSMRAHLQVQQWTDTNWSLDPDGDGVFRMTTLNLACLICRMLPRLFCR
ncbi:hypothetical protein BaRGS_00030818 [Batillaria attramentaria]|uniref:Uncharacterized protein n=1 Tax=Batillaria attramentaria TaxID=370345 RepID=A0ABD0JTE2_9CAEN